MQKPVRTVCAKFKVDSLSRFCTGACQVSTTQKPFPSPIPLTMKMQHQILFEISFLIRFTTCQISFEIFDVKQIYTRKESKYLNSIMVFSVFIPFFCWNEISKKSSIKEDTWKIENCKANHILDRNSHWRCSTRKNVL